MLPTDAKKRKDIPIYSGFWVYFPDAIAAVAELSRLGNDQHNPGKPLFWDRSKSGDELDALARHLTDHAKGVVLDADGVRHLTKNAWRAMAALQKALESKTFNPDDVLPEKCPVQDYPSRWLMRGPDGCEWKTSNVYTYCEIEVLFPGSTPILRLPEELNKLLEELERELLL
jgi:hypothetical protein